MSLGEAGYLFLSACADQGIYATMSGAQNVISGPAASAVCENLLEMQILRLSLTNIESGTLHGRAQ